MKKTLKEHFNRARGPKRILACDGGGIKGALSLGYLQRIEDILRQQSGNDPQFRLSDWQIDGEMGDLKDDLIPKDSDQKALLTYLSYNMWLDKEHLELLMKRSYSKDKIVNLIEMSNADNRFELNEIGIKDAQDKVLASHFTETFKI